MPNQTFTIKTVENKGTYILITDTQGNRYSGFATTKDGQPTGYLSLTPNDEIEADITTQVKNGKTYKNIGAFHVIARNMSASKGEPTTRPPVEVSGPEHGLCLKMVGDLYLGGKLKDDDVLVKKMWSELHRVLGTGK